MTENNYENFEDFKSAINEEFEDLSLDDIISEILKEEAIADGSLKIDIAATWGNVELEFKSIYKGSARGLAEYRKANNRMLSGLKGVYVYVADNGECIYIGKAKVFSGRIREHNKELGVEELAAELHTVERMKYIECFTPHKERNIELFFVELESESERVFVELSLQEMFPSQFKHAAARHIANKKVHIF